MPIRRDTNPRPLALSPELQSILQRNGMSAQVVDSSNGFALIVQGHDSPVLTYPISEKQLRLLTDWGSNSANKKAYNTFASIVAADFDMPKDFVHARNANERVAMGLHGYRIGVGEYGRLPFPGHHHHYHHHMMGAGFHSWTLRQQGGWHMRRIGHDLYFPGAPMVPTRPDSRMKPGELAAGGYGFYHEISRLTENMEKLGNQITKSPGNAVAVALTPRRNGIYRELVMTSVGIVNDIRQVCLSDIKMTEKERIEIVFGIRPKLRHFNKKLQHLILAVKYTSLSDVWYEIDLPERSYHVDRGRISDAARPIAERTIIST